MIDIDAYKQAFRRLPSTIAEAEVNAERHKLGLVRLYGGKIIGEDQYERQALYLRVSGEKTGYL